MSILWPSSWTLSILRHLHDENGLICPGRIHHYESDHSDTSDFNFNEDTVDIEHDSSFDFGSEPDDLSAQLSSSLFADDMITDDISDTSSLMSFTSSLTDGEEIWDLMSSEDESVTTGKEHDVTGTANGILYGIYLFLNNFQLFYRVSERAMVALLGFFKVLFAYLANITQNSVLSELVNKLPKSLYSIRKCFQFSQEDLTEFVVCPQCIHLTIVLLCNMGTLSQSCVTILSFRTILIFPDGVNVARF